LHYLLYSTIRSAFTRAAPQPRYAVCADNRTRSIVSVFVVFTTKCYTNEYKESNVGYLWASLAHINNSY